MSNVTRIQRRASEPNLDDKGGKKATTKTPMTALVKRDDVQLPERLQALLTDDFDHEEFQRKLELLKCRYKHAVKSELISFCYASSDASGDDGLVSQTNRSPDFVRTLMNIVEKDKEIADLAVNLVEEIDVMEKAKVHNMTKRKAGEEPEDPLFKSIWENHEKSRKQVAKVLEEERNQIYGQKDINVKLAKDDDEDEDNDVPVWARTNYDKWERKPVNRSKPAPPASSLSDGATEEFTPKDETPVSTSMDADEAELREAEIKLGMQKLLNQLGCADAVAPEASYEQKLAVIQERVKDLKEQVSQLREMSTTNIDASHRSVYSVTSVASTTAVSGSTSE